MHNKAICLPVVLLLGLISLSTYAQTPDPKLPLKVKKTIDDKTVEIVSSRIDFDVVFHTTYVTGFPDLKNTRLSIPYNAWLAVKARIKKDDRDSEMFEALINLINLKAGSDHSKGWYEEIITAFIKAIENGANVNAKDVNGNTALTFAVAIDDKLLCKLLLDHGAVINPLIRCDYEMGSFYFQSPLDLCISIEKKEMADFLQWYEYRIRFAERYNKEKEQEPMAVYLRTLNRDRSDFETALSEYVSSNSYQTFINDFQKEVEKDLTLKITIQSILPAISVQNNYTLFQSQYREALLVYWGQAETPQITNFFSDLFEQASRLSSVPEKATYLLSPPLWEQLLPEKERGRYGQRLSSIFAPIIEEQFMINRYPANGIVFIPTAEVKAYERLTVLVKEAMQSYARVRMPEDKANYLVSNLSAIIARYNCELTMEQISNSIFDKIGEEGLGQGLVSPMLQIAGRSLQYHDFAVYGMIQHLMSVFDNRMGSFMQELVNDNSDFSSTAKQTSFERYGKLISYQEGFLNKTLLSDLNKMSLGEAKGGGRTKDFDVMFDNVMEGYLGSSSFSLSISGMANFSTGQNTAFSSVAGAKADAAKYGGGFVDNMVCAFHNYNSGHTAFRCAMGLYTFTVIANKKDSDNIFDKFVSASEDVLRNEIKENCNTAKNDFINAYNQCKENAANSLEVQAKAAGEAAKKAREQANASEDAAKKAEERAKAAQEKAAQEKTKEAQEAAVKAEKAAKEAREKAKKDQETAERAEKAAKEAKEKADAARAKNKPVNPNNNTMPIPEDEGGNHINPQQAAEKLKLFKIVHGGDPANPDSQDLHIVNLSDINLDPLAPYIMPMAPDYQQGGVKGGGRPQGEGCVDYLPDHYDQPLLPRHLPPNFVPGLRLLEEYK